MCWCINLLCCTIWKYLFFIMYLASYYSWSQIRETPHKPHHKFIEFDDVRAAEAALRALNRTDIAGKRIKLEPSRPGGARRRYCPSTLTSFLFLFYFFFVRKWIPRFRGDPPPPRVAQLTHLNKKYRA